MKAGVSLMRDTSYIEAIAVRNSFASYKYDPSKLVQLKKIAILWLITKGSKHGISSSSQDSSNMLLTNGFHCFYFPFLDGFTSFTIATDPFDPQAAVLVLRFFF